jgi:hypothetical protein
MLPMHRGDDLEDDFDIAVLSGDDQGANSADDAHDFLSAEEEDYTQSGSALVAIDNDKKRKRREKDKQRRAKAAHSTLQPLCSTANFNILEAQIDSV